MIRHKHKLQKKLVAEEEGFCSLVLQVQAVGPEDSVCDKAGRRRRHLPLDQLKQIEKNKHVFEFISPQILILSHFPPSQVEHFYYIICLYISCIFLSDLTQRRKVIKGMTKNLNNLKQIKSGYFDKYFAVHRFNFCFYSRPVYLSPCIIFKIFFFTAL